MSDKSNNLIIGSVSPDVVIIGSVSPEFSYNEVRELLYTLSPLQP